MTLDELLDKRRLRRSPHRPAPGGAARDARGARRALARRAGARGRAARHTARATARARRSEDRERSARRDQRARGTQRAVAQLHRHGLLRHAYAGRDPAQRAREPRLVHRVHALPGRDLARPARGAAQFPADGDRPHRAAGGKRVAARRSDRGGGGDGDDPAQREEQGGRVLRRRGRASAGPWGHAYARKVARHRARRGRRASAAERFRRVSAVSRYLRPHPRFFRSDRESSRGPGPRRHGHRPPRAPAAAPAGRARRRHRDRLGAALRRADGLRRPARRVHGVPRRIQALPARADHRRLGRRGRQAGAAHGAADARAAHPPRQGDEQHLHRPGAAREHGRLLRRLPRPARPRAHCAAHEHHGSSSRRVRQAGERGVFRHVGFRRALPRGSERPRERKAHQPALPRTTGAWA